MKSVPTAGPKTLCLQVRAGADSTLHVDVPVEIAGADYNLVIVVQYAVGGLVQNHPSTFVLSAEVEREQDGRWFAEIREVPGAFAYGQTRDEAINHATALALRALADRLEGVEESGPDVSANAEGSGK